MDKIITPANISEAIINKFDGDAERVLVFYEAAYTLKGLSPIVDQVLELLDAWLIERTIVPSMRPILDKLAEEGYGDDY
jgi:hypothetical protein